MWKVLVPFTLLIACSSESPPLAQGSITGQAFLTSPFRNATVDVYVLDDQGAKVGGRVAEATTDDTGHFVVDVQASYGLMLVEVGSTGLSVFHESATDTDIVLDQGVYLSTVVELRPGDDVTVLVTPITTLGVALAKGRVARGDREDTFLAAHTEAARLLSRHFQGDAWQVVPSALTGLVGTVTEVSG
jgi:phytoene dehydrogenase-like protein